MRFPGFHSDRTLLSLLSGPRRDIRKWKRAAHSRSRSMSDTFGNIVDSIPEWHCGNRRKVPATGCVSLRFNALMKRVFAERARLAPSHPDVKHRSIGVAERTDAHAKASFHGTPLSIGIESERMCGLINIPPPRFPRSPLREGHRNHWDSSDAPCSGFFFVLGSMKRFSEEGFCLCVYGCARIYGRVSGTHM